MNLNESVITTKYVIHEHSLITYVCHRHEGDWQFLGSEQGLTSNDGLHVSLGEIIELDPSLAPLINMPPGKQAFRESPDDKWDIYNININIFNYFAPGNENICRGIELKEGIQWSFAKLNPMNFRIDGFILVNNRFIEKKELEYEDGMLIEILPLKYSVNQDAALIDSIPLNDNVALFSRLQQLHRLLAFVIEGEDGFFVGKILEVNPTYFTLEPVGPRLETCPTKNFTYDQVNHITFDNDYLQSLELLDRERNSLYNSLSDSTPE